MSLALRSPRPCLQRAPQCFLLHPRGCDRGQGRAAGAKHGSGGRRIRRSAKQNPGCGESPSQLPPAAWLEPLVVVGVAQSAEDPNFQSVQVYME